MTEMLAQFHFLRPWWLTALAPLLTLGFWWLLVRIRANPWAHVVDAHLLDHLTGGGKAARRRGRAVIVAVMAGWTLAVLALAGPSWDKAPPVRFHGDAPPVAIVLDLSRAMDAVDVRPTRLVVAKDRIRAFLDVLPQRPVGLVVFGAQGHVAMPLTEDRRIVAATLSALETALMPGTGANTAANTAQGLERAARLIGADGHASADLIVVTSRAEDAAIERARTLRGQGIRTHVLAVGTDAGGPIRMPDTGRFMVEDGAQVHAHLDFDRLSALAAAGGGVAVRVDTLGGDVAALIDALAPARARADGAEDGPKTVEPWRDRGPWLLAVLVPLAALAFRRGWLGAALVAMTMAGAAPAPAANADEGGGWWRTPDQRAFAAYAKGDMATAARLFRDPAWRGTMHYLQEDYAAAVEAWRGLDTPSAHYNRGNALARLELLDDAIAAYDEAIRLDPAHRGARENRRLVERVLEARARRHAPSEPPAPAPSGPSQDRGETTPFVEERLETPDLELMEKTEDRAAPDNEDFGDPGGAAIVAEGSDAPGEEQGAGTGQSGTDRDGARQDRPDGAPDAGSEAGGATIATDPSAADAGPSAQPPPAGHEPEGDDAGDARTASPTAAAPAEAEEAKPEAGSRPAGRDPAETQTPPQGGGIGDQGQEREQDDAPEIAAGPVIQEADAASAERLQAMEQWLRRVPDDPAAYLREKFRREYERNVRGPRDGGTSW